MSGLFPLAKEKFLSAELDLMDDDIKVVLIDEDDHVPDLETDTMLSDISSAVVATSGNLSNKSITGGVFNADPVVLSSVTGDEFESIVIYKDSGDPATSVLIAYIEDCGATPDGTNITITWATGLYKIFSI
jgi:hypothetical protein